MDQGKRLSKNNTGAAQEFLRDLNSGITRVQKHDGDEQWDAVEGAIMQAVTKHWQMSSAQSTVDKQGRKEKNEIRVKSGPAS